MVSKPPMRVGHGLLIGIWGGGIQATGDLYESGVLPTSTGSDHGPIGPEWADRMPLRVPRLQSWPVHPARQPVGHAPFLRDASSSRRQSHV